MRPLDRRQFFQDTAALAASLAALQATTGRADEAPESDAKRSDGKKAEKVAQRPMLRSYDW